MEILLQDLLHSCHTEDTADDCIVTKLLTTLKNAQDSALHSADWRQSAYSWKAEHAKSPTNWLELKTLMQEAVLEYLEEDISSGRPAKIRKVLVPAGMALVATSLATMSDGISALTAQFEHGPAGGAQQVRTRQQKLKEERERELSRSNAEKNKALSGGTQKKSTKKSNLKGATGGSTAPSPRFAN
eukprot:1294481-Rhodomonas_salina.1